MSTPSFVPASDPARPAAPGGHPWRVAVIGSVTVLAVAIGLAVGAFLTTSRASALGAGAAYVPASAAFYVELQLEPSAEQDAALRELIGRFPAIDGVDLDRPLGDQLAELLDEALAEDELDLTWTEDVVPWTDGRVAVSVLEFPAAAFDPMADPTTMTDPPPVLILLGVTDADAARDAIARILDAAGEPLGTPTEHGGVTIQVAADGPGAYAVTDDQLIAAASVDDIITALDAQAAGTTLAARGEIAALIETLPSDWLAFGVFDFTDAMAAALEAAGTESAASSAAMARILEHQTLRSAFTVAATEDGLAIDTAGTPPTGPFAVENAERGLAASVPGDALYYAEGGNIGAVLAEVVGSLKEAAASEPEAADGIATAEAALGAGLEDLVSWIDDGAIAIGWDGSEPYAGLVLVPSDRDAAERRLGQLATFATLAALDPASGITVDEATIGAATVTTIRWEDPGMSEMMMGLPTAIGVQYALTDDLVLVGVGERFVGRVLELDPAASLAEVAGYVDAVATLGGPGSTGTAWVDLAGILAAVETAAGPMLGTEGDEALAWFRPFDRIVSVARLEGEVLVQRTVVLVR